ncbi:hypothetical protein FHS83_001904 [Rhizomicrobium palustre]|uniref:Uncharacterized protein n=1 Tax=Rhizomicrobium palustre TaxID=189966 RepID=A0A846MYS3_9PROT|nr:hypothetical protein [Rhizomicrobium palustre]NIK88586.1 hypothetical protein [Rhizomicrobium palustre]
MAGQKIDSGCFFRLGAVFWLIIAALVGVAHFIWPIFSETRGFATLFVIAALALGFGLVYLAKPKE